MDPKIIANRTKNIILLCFLMLSLLGCKENSHYKPSYSKSAPKKKTLILGCSTPSFYEPNDQIVQYLNKRLKNVQLKIVSGTNYEEYVKKTQQGAYDITFSNGLSALKNQKNGYKIVAKFESDSTYYAVIFANKNSNIKEIKDLKGKKFAVGSKGTILGEMEPLVFLQKNGLNVYHDLNLIYYPSFETCILNVYLNKCDAGVSWVTSWNKYTKSHPEILKKLEVKWKTNKQLNWAVIIKNEIDPKVTDEIVNLLLELHKNPAGRRALKTLEFTRIIKADSNTYTPMRKLQNEFDQLPK